MQTRWSDDELKVAIANSTSLRQVIQKLGLIPVGGNYATVGKRIKFLELPTNFAGIGWRKGTHTPIVPARPLKEVLVRNSPPYTSHHLKRRLIKEGLLLEQCECGLGPLWMDKPLSLHLDHKNGDHHDNRLSNLRLLCPNCHSQTETYSRVK